MVNVSLGNRVTSIGSYAFAGCTLLKNLTLSAELTQISFNAFYNC